MRAIIAVSALGAGLALSGQMALAAEFYIGEPVVKEGLQLVPNYLTGIEMDRHPPGMSMDPNSIHVEIDVHATKDEKHGFSEDAWIPYLTIATTLEKVGSKYKEAKKLAPMTAGDGPHYANNFKMDGQGQYKITYVIEPPSKQGFIRHVDKATGVPAWWEPISVSWTFDYPSKPKAK
ncbi:MAG: iron transporter [Hyphomicrobiales bacterium]